MYVVRLLKEITASKAFYGCDGELAWDMSVTVTFDCIKPFKLHYRYCSFDS